MAEKIDLTPVEVDPSLSDEAEFGKPDNDSKSYGMFLKAFSIIRRCRWHSFTLYGAVRNSHGRPESGTPHDRVGTDVYDQPANRKNSAQTCRRSMTLSSCSARSYPVRICTLWMRNSPNALARSTRSTLSWA